MTRCATRYFRIDTGDLAYLKFILEGYEGMSTLRTVDRAAGIVEVIIPISFAGEMDRLLAALRGEIAMTEAERPPGWEPLAEECYGEESFRHA